MSPGRATSILPNSGIESSNGNKNEPSFKLKITLSANYKVGIRFAIYLVRKENMKKIMERVVGFVKREWFLLIMVVTISGLVLLFEVL